MGSYDSHYQNLDQQFPFAVDFINDGHQSPPAGMPMGNRNLAPQQPGDLPGNDTHDSNSSETLGEIVGLLKQVVPAIIDFRRQNDEVKEKLDQVLKKQEQSYKILEHLKRMFSELTSWLKRTVSWGKGPARPRADLSSQIIAPYEPPMWSDQLDQGQPRGENKVQELLLEVARAQNRATLGTIYAKLATKKLIGLQTIADFAEP